MTTERLAKIEAFRYTPEGLAAQCFLDELTAEIRQSWAEIKWLREERNRLHRELLVRHHTHDGKGNPAEDAGEHPAAAG